MAYNKLIVIDCVGDSLTSSVQSPTYPRILQTLFHESGMENVRVNNRGKEGFTVGDYLALQHSPEGLKTLQGRDIDFVLILLGGNDTRSTKDTSLADFKLRYQELIDIYLMHENADGQKPQIVLLSIPWYYGPVDIFWRGETHRFDAADRIVTELNPAIEELSDENRLGRIDILSPLKAAGPDIFIDGIHPTAEGNRIIAETCFRYLQPLIEPK